MDKCHLVGHDWTTENVIPRFESRGWSIKGRIEQGCKCLCPKHNKQGVSRGVGEVRG